MLCVGTALGPYRILGTLGTGGMGEVYRAHDPRLGRDVALKILHPEQASDPDRLARFEREAKTVAALNHPNIVTVYSIEDVDGIRFMTMELVAGQSLDQLIARGGLVHAETLDLAIALTEALAAAHEKGVIHRDLKPGNVMVTQAGLVKVLDFGVAKLMETRPEAPAQSRTETTPITETGQFVGTVPYMAPEQLRGEAVDARTDLYALGVLLYELTTGRRPFTGRSPFELGSSILRDSPVPATMLRADLPPELARTISRCMEKDPGDRPQTSVEVGAALRRVRQALLGATGESVGPLVPRREAPAPSIAVLPFLNVGSDPENEYFAVGLSEELINVLSKIPGLHVAARTSSFHVETGGDLESIGRQLKVATVLEGSVRRAGERLRVAVHLVQVADGFSLWSGTYDRKLENIFDIQDDIAQRVVKELRAALLGESAGPSAIRRAKEEVATAARGRGGSVEAHRLYLQGRFFVDNFTREGLAKGIRYFQEAVELDPTCALAWAGLARASRLEAAYSWAPTVEGYARARQFAERALQLEPDLAEGHLALGWVRLEYDWDWKGAAASFDRLLDLAPGSAAAVAAAGRLSSIAGRLEDAISHTRRATELDPLATRSYQHLGWTCLYAGLTVEAETALRKSLELNPQGAMSHFILALVLLARGQVDAALSEVEQEPAGLFRLVGRAVVGHALQRTKESDEALQTLIAEHANDAACQIAEACAFRGEVDRAFDWLAQARAQRDPGLTLIRVDTLLRPLHGDARWQPFLDSMGLGD